MRVLHVITSLATGGAEKLILETVPKLNEEGIVTEVLLLNGFEHPFYQELKNKNTQIYHLGMKSVYNPFHIFKIIPYLKKYDLVHVHLFPTLYFVAIAKLISLTSTPLIYTEHNTSNRRMENRFFHFVQKYIYKAYKKVICINEEVKNIMVKTYNGQKNKFYVIENAVDIKKIDEALPLLKSEFGFCDSDFLIAMVASFRKQKDQKTLIKSMKGLPHNMKLLLVGEGELKKECEIFVEELGLSDRVRFLGVRKDVYSILKTVDVSVLSSNYEGFGLAAVEGMAVGKPFLGSDVPGLRDTIGDAGVLFPKGDEIALIFELKKLFESPSHYQNVSEKCKQRAQEFDIYKMIEKTKKFYYSLF